MCQPHAKFLAQLAALALLAGALTSCGSVPEGREPPPEAIAAPPDAFSAQAAWLHLEALTEIGPRQTGTRGAARARRYLREQLEDLGASVEERTLELEPSARKEPSAPGGEPSARKKEPAAPSQPRVATHLIALLPGESSDRFLLAASYDTRALPGIEFVGANASASGPALVLELARALSERPRPYTLMIALIDGDGLPATRPGTRFPGSRSLASWLAEEEEGGAFSKIRLAVFFQQVGDIDLSIARDLRSHPIYREFFWEAAAVLGREIYFPKDADVETVDGGHLEFVERGLPRSVVIADPRYGGPDVPGRYAATEKDSLERCSPDSLGAVGEVALEALSRISVRLARIDRFHRAPLRDPLAGDAAPAPARMADPAASQAPVDAPEAN